MKKDILILAALIAVVIAVPFLATKAEEAIQIKNEEFKEKQNRECYEKAEECMDAGKYDEAIELLEKLPGYYEDVEYIYNMQSFAMLFRMEKELRNCISLYGMFQREMSTVANI